MMIFSGIGEEFPEQTAHIRLRYMEPSDWPSIANIFLEPKIWEKGYADSSRRPETMEDAMALVEERYHNVLTFIVEGQEQYNYEILGTTGIVDYNAETETAKIGRTIIHPNYWGKGINHDIKLVILDWLFNLGIGRVECDVSPININSMRSLEKFGFTFEGIKRRAVRRPDGSWRDLSIFSMVTEEWGFKRQNIINPLKPQTHHSTLIMPN